jgi:hypothetical protein
MRQGLMTVAEHCRAIANVADSLGKEQVLAVVGNGNLYANDGHVAYANGDIHRLDQEPIYKRSYRCVTAWKDGRVSAETLKFGRENGCAIVFRQEDGSIHEITRAIDFATSGQPLVIGGTSVPLEQISEEWCDTRHLVQPLRIDVNGDALYVPNAQLQQGLTRKALIAPVRVRLEACVDDMTRIPLTISGWSRMAKGDLDARTSVATFLKKTGLLGEEEALESPPVLLRMAETFERLLEDALVRGDYRLVDDRTALKEGEGCFVNGHLELFLKKARYPANIFVMWAGGDFGVTVFPGKSGREGPVLSEAQRFLTEELRVEEGILLDNGGDVRLWYRGQYLIPSSERREEIRSVLALTAPDGIWCGNAVTVY